MKRLIRRLPKPSNDPSEDSYLLEEKFSKLSRDTIALDTGSIDSSELPKSTSQASFGSCDEVDSFVNASISGFVSEDTLSHFADDPAYALLKPRGQDLPAIRSRPLLGAQPVHSRIKQQNPDKPVDKSSFQTPPLTPNSSVLTLKQHSDGSSHRHNQQVLFDSPQSILPVRTPLPRASLNEEFSLTSTDSLSSTSSSVALRSTRFENPHKNISKRNPALEVDLWKHILIRRVSHLGPQSMHVATGLVEIGAVHLRNKQHLQALAVYKKAARILRHEHAHVCMLAVAHALDKVGLAASLSPSLDSCTSSSQENLDWGLVALREAFKIRYNYLGPWHVDVVDTLNNIGGIHLRRGEKEDAYQAYLQVLTTRIAIFGKYHASVAVTAHILGNLCVSRAMLNEARNYFKVCLVIYRDGMKLKDRHPLLQKTFKGLDKVQQLMSCMARG